MGLSQRKDKQKIGNDPRNLQWSNDQNRFAFKHMTSLGWSPSTGLGSTLVGNPNHIAVARKLDSHGIGVDRAMREGKDVEGSRAGEGLESVLQRLRGSGGGSPIIFMTNDDDDEDAGSGTVTPAESSESTVATTIVPPAPTALAPTITTTTTYHHPLASRQKHIRSKRLLASSPAAMAEILGIPLSSMPSSASGSGANTPVSAAADEVDTKDGIKQELVVKLEPGTEGSIGGGIGSGSGFRSGSGIGMGFSASQQSEVKPIFPVTTDRSSPPPTSTSTLSVSDYFRQKLAQRQAEREGRPVPEMQYGRRDVGAGGGENLVAKDFEGKRVVFGGDEEEEKVVDVRAEKVESPAIKLQASSQAPVERVKKEKVEKKEKKDKKDKSTLSLSAPLPHSAVETSSSAAPSLAKKSKKRKADSVDEPTSSTSAVPAVIAASPSTIVPDPEDASRKVKKAKKSKTTGGEVASKTPVADAAGEGGAEAKARRKKEKKEKRSKVV